MNDKQDFTRGSIPVKMVRFMLPILGALILQAMYSAVDLLMVGKFGTTAGISAVSTGSSFVNLMVFTISGLSMGITVLIGRYLGEGNRDRVSKVLGGVIWFFAILALALTVLILIFAGQLTTLLSAPAEAYDLTKLYIRICGGGVCFVIAYNVISSIFRGLGDSKMPLIFVLIACITNIVGDFVLIAIFHMNVAGAAIATIAAQAVSVILSVVIIHRRGDFFSIRREDIRYSAEVRKFLTLGSPLAAQELLTNLTFLCVCIFINGLGLEQSSGYGVAMKLMSFIMLLPSSIVQSMSSFVAQNVGAGREDRAKRALVCGVSIGTAFGLFISYMAFFHGDLLSNIFTNDPAVIARSAEYLRGVAPESIITCTLFGLMGYFNGHERSKFVMVQGLAQSFIIRLPFAYIMSRRPDVSLTYIALAAPIATAFGIVLCGIYYVRMQKQLKIGTKG